ncbi:MAG: hypothetical protein C5B51_27615 [Terriglobia bacterium]|nr:MAG: hypothetical protein C5B51_27615 [Terriglobia bacterium]
MKTPLTALFLLIAPAYGAISNVKVAGTTSTQAVISYTAPDNNPCMIEISESSGYTPLVHDVDTVLFPGANSDNRPGNISIGRTRIFVAGKRAAEIAADIWRYSRALQAFTPHYFRVTCGADQAAGTFTTTNIPLGNTFPEVAPVDPAHPGEYAWPYMPWASANPSMIDPQTGILFKPLTKPRRSYIALGPSGFGNARDIGGLGEWANPAYALSNNAGQAAVYSGTQRSWLWLQTSNFQTPYGGGADWSDDGYSVNYFEPQFKVWSSDGQAEVCLTADGVSCRSAIRTISVPTSEPTSPQNVGDTNSPMVYWNDALHIVSKPNMVRRSGTVNIDTSGNATWTGGDVFNPNWTAGSRLTIANSDCAISSVTNDVSLKVTLSSCPGLSVPATGVSYLSDNFGVLIRAHSASASVSVKAARWVSEESTDTGWVAGDMPVLCSDALVPDNSVPPQSGFHCSIGGLVWINPATGETRNLGDATRPPGGSYGGDQVPSGTPCLADGSPFAADGNTEYCLANLGTGPILMKGVYSGNNQDIGPYAYGLQASPMNWSNLTPIAQHKGLLDLLHNFDATFDKTLFANCYERGLTGDRTKVVGDCRRDAQQDVIAWLWIFDPSTASIVAAWPTWKMPAARWCKIHSYAQVVSSPSWAAVEFSSNATNANHGGTYGGQGMWTTTLTSGALSQTAAIASGAPIPGFAGLSCPAGYAGCDVVTVAGEPCDFDPAANEPRNCPYNSSATYLQDAIAGDILEFDTGTNGQQEAVQLLGKSGNTWAILRGYWVKYNFLTEAHAANSKLQAQCGVGPVDTTLWNFVADSHGQDVTASTVIPDGHGFSHGAYTATIGAGVADWRDCPAGSNGICSSIKKGVDVASYANRGASSTPLTTPLFAGKQGLNSSSLVEAYLAPGPSFPQPGTAGDYVIAARPLESDGGWNTVTPVSGQLYKVSVNYNPPQVKTLATLAMCGMHPLSDVSGPGSTIGTGAPASYTYCIANAGGECQPGSQPGNVFVNCPNYYGKNQGCAGNEDDRGICIGANAMQAHKISQTSTTIRAANGSDTRALTSAFHPYRVGPSYWNARVLPDGSWAIVRAPFFNATRPEVFLAKLPPMPAPDSVARNTFVPIRVTLTPPAGLAVNNAIVEFGYAENGQATDFYCTTRRESCVAAAAAINEAAPFAFAGENPAGVPCGASCTIQIPAIPQRIVYYRVKYRSASNQVLATGSPQAAAAP